MTILSEIATIPIGSYTAWGAVILVGVSGIVQVSPIKINPWSRLARMIGNAINKDIIDKVDRLEADISKMQQANNDRDAQEEERNVRAARQRILRFGDEVRHEQNHSEEHYDDILDDITYYENYCGSHPNFKNQKAQSTIKIIVKAYEAHMQNGDFLD